MPRVQPLEHEENGPGYTHDAFCTLFALEPLLEDLGGSLCGDDDSIPKLGRVWGHPMHRAIYWIIVPRVSCRDRPVDPTARVRAAEPWDDTHSGGKGVKVRLVLPKRTMWACSQGAAPGLVYSTIRCTASGLDSAKRGREICEGDSRGTIFLRRAFSSSLPSLPHQSMKVNQEKKILRVVP